MVNHGEEKVRVHINVVPRSTRKTNSGTEWKIVPDFLCATLWLSRQSNGRSNPEVVGSIPTEVKIFFLCLMWFPVSLY